MSDQKCEEQQSEGNGKSPFREDFRKHALLNTPIHTERPMKVICAGAGLSGLLLAYKLQRSFEKFELTVYEKNEDVTGTWFENRYPGCGCDIPAHIYTYTFEPKHDWSKTYAGSKEIYDYYKRFAERYNLHKYIRLNHRVSGAYWDEGKGAWKVEVTDVTTGNTFQDNCDIFINAAGVLNDWKWPDIPGLSNFKGTRMHTAHWDTEADLTNKSVGIIGNGSSGLQVLPAVHDSAKKITAFLRSATWIIPMQGMEQREYTEEEILNFKDNPEALLDYRKKLESKRSSLFPLFHNDTKEHKVITQKLTELMKEKLNNPNIDSWLIPKWGFGCRRFTPGINYMETLASEKVQVVHGGITQITEHGCVAENGQEYLLDVLICATGFNTWFAPRFPVVGEKGKNLAVDWKTEAKGYFGVAAADIPNYFTLLGPNSPVNNGPLIAALEAQVAYVLKFMNRWQTENIHSMSPKAEAVEDFIAYKDNFMTKMVWTQDCRSWYKNNSVSGKVTAIWPGSSLHYLEALAEPRYEDWNIKYKGNRFLFLGNGYSQTESDDTADWAYYMRKSDDSPLIGRSKWRKMITKSGTLPGGSRLPQDCVIS